MWTVEQVSTIDEVPDDVAPGCFGTDHQRRLVKAFDTEPHQRFVVAAHPHDPGSVTTDPNLDAGFAVIDDPVGGQFLDVGR